MKRINSSSGFSLMELLTVIAIIAILAAVMFPVFRAVKDNAKKTSCMANLQSIGVALQEYKEDNKRYPTSLFDEYNPADPNKPMDECSGALYPEYVKSIDNFTCPVANPENKNGPIPPLASPGFEVLRRVGPDIQKVTVYYYQGDSYDWTDLTGEGPVWATYAWAWAVDDSIPSMPHVGDRTPNVLPDTVPLQKRDFARQLWFDKPESTTVVTWCMNHSGKDGKALVLFLDAKVVLIDKKKMRPTDVGSSPENILYRVKP
ncbi:MAG: prepilin-type N-terminal cleavage/methylation domain-containing protein [Armatimonadota bacterium]|nr:prepilin-type N-terminal cleavage/methylation domain-containing protein [Armatimonadota bacterium]